MLPETVAGRAVAGTLFVTVAGNAVIALFLYFDVGPGALRVLVAFAVGGMLGDVFLHLLPHATEGGGHDHHHHHHHHESHEGHEGHAHTLADLTLGFSILAGIIFFFIVETGLRGWTGGGGHSHAHSHAHAAPAAAPVEVDPSVRASRRSKSTTRKRRSSTPAASRRSKEKKLSSGETTSNGLASALTGLKPAALLNLGADALHNFTDGLAIAVACQRGSAMAVSTILAVAVHELPHEIGDFAVLVQQGGFTKRGAFMAQWVSALGAFAGCVVGLEYGKESPLFVLGFTAGGFLYISLVNIMPDMLSQRPSMGEAAAQVVFMGLGIGMMVFVALYCE
jgi:solute carrier family 39 (zinc transporter), member 7